MRPLLPSLSHYQLLAEISSGGMGTVYLARDERSPGFEKLVALKRIHPHLAQDPRFVAMFMDEARIASMVRHANVCGVEDYGVEHGTYYLTMEYLSGETLASVIRCLRDRAEAEPELVKSGRFFTMAARLLADACEGLHAAHELTNARGERLELVHRDISPPNLFVGYDGVLRILDFGIAKAAHRIAETTADGLKGKIAYMAPEQIARREVDRRADVWALGVVAFELLTQSRLFRREDDIETFKAILEAPIPLASDRVPDIPPELDAAIQRALARAPEDRFATAREMGRELTLYLADCGLPSGLADVSEWMGDLFPGREAQARGFVEQAQRTETGPRDALALASAGDATQTADTEISAALPPGRLARAAPVVGGALLASVVTAAIVMVTLGPRDAASPSATAATERQESVPDSVGSAPIEGEAVEAAPVPSTESEPIETRPIESEPAPSTEAPAPPARVRRRPRRTRRAPLVASQAAPAEAAGEGTVQVVTTGGWGTVLYRGRSLGTTPARFNLPAGRQRIQVRTEDGRTRSVTVEVRPGRVTPITVAL